MPRARFFPRALSIVTRCVAVAGVVVLLGVASPAFAQGVPASGRDVPGGPAAIPRPSPTPSPTPCHCVDAKVEQRTTSVTKNGKKQEVMWPGSFGGMGPGAKGSWKAFLSLPYKYTMNCKGDRGGCQSTVKWTATSKVTFQFKSTTAPVRQVSNGDIKPLTVRGTCVNGTCTESGYGSADYSMEFAPPEGVIAYLKESTENQAKMTVETDWAATVEGCGNPKTFTFKTTVEKPVALKWVIK